MITQKMAGQERSDIYVVYTITLCALKLKDVVITLLSDLIYVSNQIWYFLKPFGANL